MRSKSTRDNLRKYILPLLCLIGLLLCGCNTGSSPTMPDKAELSEVSAITDVTSPSMTSLQTSSQTISTVIPTDVPVPEFSFNASEVGCLFEEPAKLEYTMDGIYYLCSENVIRFPESEQKSLSLYLAAEEYCDEVYSNDGSCVAVIPLEDSNGLGKLFYCDGTTARLVSDDVDTYALSDDGSTLLYLKGFYDQGVGGALFLYDRNTNESILIAEGAGRLFAVSPSGNAYAYTTFREKNNPDSLVCHYFVTGGQMKILGENLFPIALTDDADIIYTQQIERDGGYFSIYEKGEKIRLFEDKTDESVAQHLFFNKDYTQLVFVVSGRTYLYMSGYPTTLVFWAGITSIAQDARWRTISDGARNDITIGFPGTKNLCFLWFRIDPEREAYDKEQVALNISFNDDFHVVSTQVNPDEYDEKKKTRITTDWGPDEPIRFLRENAPDYLYYLEVDKTMPYYPEYSSDDNVPYGKFYQTLYRVEDTAGAVPVKIADLVCDVDIGEYGVIYKQYSGPCTEANDINYSYIDIVKVYQSSDGEHFAYAFDQERRLGVALGG